MQFANPENHERAWKLAVAMYRHIQEEALSGLPFPDVAAALAMLNGLYLAGGYGDKPKREAAMRAIGKTSVDYAAMHAKTFKRFDPASGGAA